MTRLQHGRSTPIAVRLRAVELTHAQALGLPLQAQTVGILVETLTWSLTAGVVGVGFATLRAATPAPGHLRELWPLAASVPAALTAAALLASPLAVWGIRRRSLDHYLRARAG